MDKQQDDQHIQQHDHQKPPPPYEEVQRESSSTMTMISSDEDKQKMEESSFNNHLSIENPMAEVFSNPEFDHVELKIQGHINPMVPIIGGQMNNKTRNLSTSSMTNMVREKFHQVFYQWKDWHRPEIIAIRLALLLFVLLLMVQLARVVMPSSMLNRNNDKPESILSPVKQELKVHSGRTGKALTSLLDPDLEPDSTDLQSIHGEIKMVKTKLEQPEQDLINTTNENEDDTSNLDPHHFSTNLADFLENESSFSKQDLSHHDHHIELEQETLEPEHVTTKIQTTKSSSTITTTTYTPTTTTTSTTKQRTRLSTTMFSTSTTIPTTKVSIINKMPDTIANNNSYTNKTYNISIIIHSANVPDMDTGYLMGRASDTYCNVFIDDVLVGKTPIIDNSNNPSWHYLLPRQFPVKRDTWIRIELMDSDHVRNDHIGGILLNFGDLLKNSSLNKPINMFHGRGYIWVTISSSSVQNL